MKRMLSLVLAIVMLLSVSGCAPLQEEPVKEAEVEAESLSAYALAEAVYPEMAPLPLESDYIDEQTGVFDDEGFFELYSLWSEEQRARWLPEGTNEAVSGFLQKSIPQFLSGSDTENRVYSPLNVYMALGMLAELTDGNSRRQILDL